MYEFRDTIDTEGTSALPSEAMKINGEYIEDLIPGYRTLSVAGREALSPEINSVTTGARDGSTMLSKRYPERIITVQYQLIAASNAAFRSAYNELGRILNVTDAEIIFNDEDDKYFIGTPYTIESVEAGTNAVVGSFEILCVDPFKYSVVEHYALPELAEGSVLLNYDGTYKAYPKIDVEFGTNYDDNTDGECGYVAFYDEDQHILQFGDPDEVDGADNFAKTQILDRSYFSSLTTGNKDLEKWTMNAGNYESTIKQDGSVGIISVVTDMLTTDYVLSRKILEVTSLASNPNVHYIISTKATNRKENSVEVTFTVTAALTRETSYFEGSYILKCALYLNGAWQEVTIKQATDKWRGKTAHTVSKKITVTGLTTDQIKLTGIQFKAYRGDNLGTTGTLAATSCRDIKINPFTATSSDKCMVGVHQNAIDAEGSGYGVGSFWHGPSMIFPLPNDLSGEPCGSSWIFSFIQLFAVSPFVEYGQEGIGAFKVKVYDADMKVIAGYNILKRRKGTAVNFQYVVNEKIVDKFELPKGAVYGNPYFRLDKTNTITKVGDTIKFEVLGKTKYFTDPDIKDVAAAKIGFNFLAYGTQPHLAYNGINRTAFWKTNCETWEDLPNTFNPGDILSIDCSNANITLNGVISPNLGALGNDWEQFCLKPGLNQIGFSYSDWVTEGYEPNIKVRYREVFL